MHPACSDTIAKISTKCEPPTKAYLKRQQEMFQAQMELNRNREIVLSEIRKQEYMVSYLNRLNK